MTIKSPVAGTLSQWLIAPGKTVAANEVIAVVESMKMEFEIRAPHAGFLRKVLAQAGDAIQEHMVLADFTATSAAATPSSKPSTPAAPIVQTTNLPAARADLRAFQERLATTQDAARPIALEKRHAKGRRSARENLADLLDANSFSEYGGLAFAAQTQRRSLEDLIANTPADGLVCGTGRIQGIACAVLVYDETVLAGTQGFRNHQKMDRLLELALEKKLPTVLFAEGGGGRPGDTDTAVVAGLNVRTFERFALLSQTVPTIGFTTGYCFAGNAALLACCELILATPQASIGMGGPAMIEGGGLGVVAPHEVGPASALAQRGGVHCLVGDEAQAVTTIKHALAILCNATTPSAEPPPSLSLRDVVPENRVRAYDSFPAISGIFDAHSLLVLRPDYGLAIHTVLARLAGRCVAVLASNPLHLGGAIDHDSALKAAQLFDLCERYSLPLISLIDTPGFMVGQAAEAQGQVSASGALFRAAARYTKSRASEVPSAAIVLRKCYGLGAMALAGGSLYRPTQTLAWPSAEFGAMGLEGAVRLGWRKELAAAPTAAAKQALFDSLLRKQIEAGSALNMASHLEIDAVIDPADSRAALVRALSFN
jgi:acetyl-CoA carboxylase carboxyltransferase component